MRKKVPLKLLKRVKAKMHLHSFNNIKPKTYIMKKLKFNRNLFSFSLGPGYNCTVSIVIKALVVAYAHTIFN
jgi:hypothetical protein